MMGYALIRRRLRISPAAVLAFAMFFYGVKSLVFGFAPTWNAAVGAAVLQALSFALLAPACVDFMLETVSPDYLATAHLVFIAAGQGAAAVLGNSLGGVLADLWGVSAMFRVGSLLAFLLFYSALKYIPAPTVSLITSLEIVFALVLTPLLLRQVPSSHELAGCAIILAAVAITTVGNAKKAAKAS